MKKQTIFQLLIALFWAIVLIAVSYFNAESPNHQPINNILLTCASFSILAFYLKPCKCSKTKSS